MARRWGVIVGVLFGISGTVIAVASPGFPLPVEGVALIEVFWPTAVLHGNTVLGTVVILGWIGLATWPAYRNAGLLVSWGILVAPIWGALLTKFVWYGSKANEPGSNPAAGPYPLLFWFLINALVLGTLGFILGTGFRRIRS